MFSLENKKKNLLVGMLKDKVKRKVLAILVLVVILIVSVFIPKIIHDMKTPQIITGQQLVKLLEVSELSTGKITYEGIAPIKNDKGKVKCHAHYIATMTASVDIEKIKFDINDEEKLIKPILPQIELNNPIIDEKSLLFLPNDTKVDMKNVLVGCEKDLKKEIGVAIELYTVAEKNLKKTIEGLLFPITNEVGYRIIWEDAEGGGNSEK